ncbi:tetratricopeptide repeat protein [Roseivirga sp. BDSF3-8]|uniref:tetratricopeptide repeat protein n=1 Tax=Roseivirga sp. BDSF3-8 TaxID=3241598 RepID=UPI003531CC94
MYYDQAEVNKGLEKIEEGIERYPDRLDMRFGKIYALGQVKDWATFTSEVIRTVQHSATNDNQWTWTKNQPKEGGQEAFLHAIQDYQVQLFNTGDTSLLANMRSIAREILDIYPEDVPSLSNLSITYLLAEEYEKGLEPLLRAEKIAPEDDVILSNIAHAYKLNGDKKKAINYYKKLTKYGSPEMQAFAEEQITELSQ